MTRAPIMAVILLLAACNEPASNPAATDDTSDVATADLPAAPAETPPTAPPPVSWNAQPIPPGQPGGLPDDRTPVSEAPFTPGSAQGAADVVQTYYAFIETGRHADAFRLWDDSGKAAGGTAEAFAKRFAGYREYHAQIGAPGNVSGAAGSLYVSVPVQAYGLRADGSKFNVLGAVTLRRANDVPGATPEQLQWRITRIGPANPDLH